MDAFGLESGQTIRVFDYSPNPRALLSLLSAPIGSFSSATLFPVVHVRRGWLHGSHAVVTVRPPAGHPVECAGHFGTLEAAIRALACELEGTPPAAADYVAAARQLGRFENVPGPYLPLRKQGHVETGVAGLPPGWPAGLVLARDLMLARLLAPVLAAAAVAGDDLPGYAMRVLALTAMTHPGGTEFGLLSYRSHSEAMLAWKGAQTSLRSAFAARSSAASADFTSALADPAGSAAPGLRDSLLMWSLAVQHCWGIGYALTLTGAVGTRALNEAGRLADLPAELHSARLSSFHEQLRADGFDENTLFWHAAHRMVVNVVYLSLACLGLTPIQRYFLCYGLSEASDKILGRTWADRFAS